MRVDNRAIGAGGVLCVLGGTERRGIFSCTLYGQRPSGDFMGVGVALARVGISWEWVWPKPRWGYHGSGCGPSCGRLFMGVGVAKSGVVSLGERGRPGSQTPGLGFVLVLFRRVLGRVGAACV